ncbi:glycosyltransferase family 32 protein [Dysgonomonas sp. ZJ279]|uniref:glycosyltransferase family 32 protein n=1 Tax=Dysgonomonas sp. ZJ279 TaxID=2709796 RepID=UPI0013EC32B9|nr:glycosyltransferase [Dysgonomonas sp. ZJ279]
MNSNKTIPHIIHQIWSGDQIPLPNVFKKLSESWKSDYPTWKYEFWDTERIDNFIIEYYPHYLDIYRRYPYNIQRWDTIRYLILNKLGGMYVDFDYESVKPLDELLEGKTCCFSLEQSSKTDTQEDKRIFNNALMACVAEHPFMKKTIEAVFRNEILEYNPIPKFDCVFNTTGPWKLVSLYRNLTQEEKNDIYLIPAKYVTPFNGSQARNFVQGERTQELNDCLEEAYAVHYFSSIWVKDEL